VIALGQGGAVEIVSDGCGVHFENPHERDLQDALDVFDRNERRFDPAWLSVRASEFSDEVFEARFRELVRRNLRLAPARPEPIPITVRRSAAGGSD
jgi:hypothetical protein